VILKPQSGLKHPGGSERQVHRLARGQRAGPGSGRRGTACPCRGRAGRRRRRLGVHPLRAHSAEHPYTTSTGQGQHIGHDQAVGRAPGPGGRRRRPARPTVGPGHRAADPAPARPGCRSVPGRWWARHELEGQAGLPDHHHEQGHRTQEVDGLPLRAGGLVPAMGRRCPRGGPFRRRRRWPAACSQGRSPQSQGRGNAAAEPPACGWRHSTRWRTRRRRRAGSRRGKTPGTRPSCCLPVTSWVVASRRLAGV
jgi:hypothetical protein